MGSRPLYIFDFDDTLAISGAKITVKKPDGRLLRLSSREFAKFSPEPGDDLSFSEFDEYPPSAVLIQDTVDAMINAIATHGPENVWILTARNITAPVAQFLSDQGISPLPRMKGTAGSAGKAPWLRKTLQENDYDSVFVWEDCQKNIDSLGAVVQEMGLEYYSTCILESVVRLTVRSILQEARLKKKLLAEAQFRGIKSNLESFFASQPSVMIQKGSNALSRISEQQAKVYEAYKKLLEAGIEPDFEFEFDLTLGKFREDPFEDIDDKLDIMSLNLDVDHEKLCFLMAVAAILNDFNNSSLTLLKNVKVGMQSKQELLTQGLLVLVLSDIKGAEDQDVDDAIKEIGIKDPTQSAKVLQDVITSLMDVFAACGEISFNFAVDNDLRGLAQYIKELYSRKEWLKVHENYELFETILLFYKVFLDKIQTFSEESRFLVSKYQSPGNDIEDLEEYQNVKKLASIFQKVNEGLKKGQKEVMEISNLFETCKQNTAELKEEAISEVERIINQRDFEQSEIKQQEFQKTEFGDQIDSPNSGPPNESKFLKLRGKKAMVITEEKLRMVVRRVILEAADMAISAAERRPMVDDPAAQLPADFPQQRAVMIGPNHPLRDTIEQQLFNLVDFTYQDMGGHVKIGNPSDLNRYKYWVVADVDSDEMIDAMVAGKDDVGGIKLGVGATDGSDPAKSWYKQTSADLRSGRSLPGDWWGEVSGRIAYALISRNAPVIEDEATVRALLAGDTFTWHGEHPNENAPALFKSVKGWYTKDFGEGGKHTKIIIGSPAL